MSREAARIEAPESRGTGAAQSEGAGPGKRSLVDGPLADRDPAGATPAGAPAQASASAAPGREETPTPGARTDGVKDAPHATYLVPFDRSPLAAPGERIICSAEFEGGTASDYEIAYSTVGGHFTSASGPTTVTIQGLISGNVNFHVPTGWNGTDAVSVTMKLKKKADGSVVQTETWNF